MACLHFRDFPKNIHEHIYNIIYTDTHTHIYTIHSRAGARTSAQEREGKGHRRSRRARYCAKFNGKILIIAQVLTL